MHCIYAFAPPTPHENIIQVKPSPPSVGVGAGKPDYKFECLQQFSISHEMSCAPHNFILNQSE